MSEHFTDLRLNKRSSGGEESFWPSFTDIMTVIVMIFLIVMLVLLIKNMDLVARLQATLEAERTATEQVASTSSLNRDLQKRLEQTQAQLDMLRMQLINMGEERDHLAGQLAQSRTALEQEQTARQQQHKNLEQEQAARTALAAQLTAATAEIASLTNVQQQQNEKLAVLERDRQQITTQLAALQGEFSNLKGKYDKLVRPARTARGKYVVKVRILRRNGNIEHFVRSPNQKAFEAVDANALHQRLDNLHAAHPDDMYVRIIFPSDSGLSYSEAWQMTESLLKKYDYYYRNPAPGNNPLDSSGRK
ncbi:MAG: hypothetical protein R8K53_00770 [Mariprofundaceae bacterium]